MATFITHLRVADCICDKINISDKALFFAGSVAPDNNMLPDVSHFCINGDKTTCDIDNFLNKHILQRTDNADVVFYLGYYEVVQ